MRKEFPVNIESEEEWIDLPQGTHIHPKEVEKMFDEEEMQIGGREYGALIKPSGKITYETYGSNYHVNMPINPKSNILTHSHPRDECPLTATESLSIGDVGSPHKEVRAISQNNPDNSSLGEIHSFKPKRNRENRNINYSGAHELNILDKQYETEDKGINKIISPTYSEFYPARSEPNIYPESEFNLARKYGGQTSVIKVRKSENPKKVYITGIRSTHKDEPQYDLLQTLPRKKKPAKPLMNRLNLTTSIKATGFGLVNLNLNGLSGMLVGSKKKKAVKKKGGKNA